MKPRDLNEAMALLDEIAEENAVLIDNKRYLMVRDRIWVFRAQFGDEYSIETDVQTSYVKDGGGVGAEAGIIATGKAVIRDSNNRVISTGHSVSWPGKGGTEAFVEMAETQAVGRALAFFGLGGDSIASVEEVHGVKAVEKKSNVVPLKPAPSVTLQQVLDKIGATEDTQGLTKQWAEINRSLSSLKTQGEIAEAKKAFAEKLKALKEKEEQDG